MELTQEHIDLLDKKYRDNLSIEEKKKLKELEQDAVFLKESNEYMAVFSSIEEGVADELKNKMNTWEEEASKPPIPIGSLKSTMKYAAIMLGFVISIVALQQFLYKPQKEFYAFYETYPSAEIVRGPESNSGFEEAMKYYKNDDFQNSLEILLNMETTPKVAFYAGQCYFGLNNYMKAKEAFANNNLIQSAYQSSAEWYEQLCNIKLTKNEEAEKSLQQMVDSNHEYADQVASLLLYWRKIK